MLNIAPLIDVVFLLIIFLAVVSHITRLEIEDITLPEGNQGCLESSEVPLRIVVNIDQNGTIMVSGAARSIEGFETMLAETTAQSTPDKVLLVIRGDRQTPWKNIAEVLRRCRAHGLHKVKVAVTNADGGFDEMPAQTSSAGD